MSNNPISSIFLIDASADVDGVPFENATADEGAIIVSGFTSNDWTISTIYTPQTATQPFSGNRQWGWIINQNGNLELFTRAVDVAKLSWIVKHWVSVFHALVRTISVIVLWYLLPEYRFVSIPITIVLFYIVTNCPHKLSPLLLELSHQDITNFKL